MQLQPADLIGAFYADDSLLWSAQDCVNWLPTVAMQKGTRTEAKLATPPGLSYFTQCGDGPIRGARDVEGKLFVVSGNELYEVAYNGTPTLRGTIPGVGLVSMSHNKRGYGNQLLIVNGDAGYVWNTSASTLTRITDEGYPGAVQVDYLDHYLIQVEPWGRFWFHSNLDNATDYNTLDQYDAEAAPDKMIGIAANQLEAVVFSQKTIEFFANTGAATGTFQSKRIVIERGCASRHTIVKLDNTLMWLGNDGIFYRLNGYGAQPISTGPIHRAIAGFDWANAFGFVWEDKGYKVAYWTFPDGQTWGYDATQPPGYQWHRRESFGLNRWRLNTCTGWQRRWIGGDYRTGVLYLLDWSAQHEMGEPLVSERTGGTANANQNAVICPYVEFLFDTGGPAWDGESGLPPALSITGDIPNGFVGDAASGTYTVTGGVMPYGAIAVLTGTLPPGITLDPDGSYSGTYSAGGSYSWTVGGVDANGTPFSVADTAEVTVTFPEWLETTTTTIASAVPTHVVSNPATVNAGDLLIYVQWSVDVDFAPPVGYATTIAGPNGRRAYYRTADGSEGGTTVNFINGAGGGRTGEYAVIRIRRWGSIEGRSDTGSDPPNFTPTGGSQKYLWIATIVGTITPSQTWPHPDHQTELSSLAVCGTSIEAASNDPPTWTDNGEMISIAVWS